MYQFYTLLCISYPNWLNPFTHPHIFLPLDRSHKCYESCNIRFHSWINIFLISGIFHLHKYSIFRTISLLLKRFVSIQNFLRLATDNISLMSVEWKYRSCHIQQAKLQQKCSSLVGWCCLQFGELIKESNDHTYKNNHNRIVLKDHTTKIILIYFVTKRMDSWVILKIQIIHKILHFVSSKTKHAKYMYSKH